MGSFLVVAALAIGTAPTRAEAAPDRPFGLGLVLGEPTGLSAKLYLAQPFALQFGLGAIDTFRGENGLHLNVDFIWHPVVITRQPAFSLPFYMGVGARYFDHSYDYMVDNVRYLDHDRHVGVRAPFGLLMDFTRVPLDVFLEVAVVVDVIYFDTTYGPLHERGPVSVNGGAGVRYYF